jgi:hypothetical protein
LSLPTTDREVADKSGLGTGDAKVSGSLDWLWARLRDNPRPRVLDCGPVRESTVNVLVERGSKLYVADLLSFVSGSNGNLWDRAGKTPVFRTERLLSELPVIPPGSLSVAFCWQLLDLLPREALAAVVRRMYLYLEPSGVLFFILREACLTKGADTIWYLETLTKLGARTGGEKPFPYPPLSNREMERLIPTGIVKTVLTRSGLREVLAVR